MSSDYATNPASNGTNNSWTPHPVVCYLQFLAGFSRIAHMEVQSLLGVLHRKAPSLYHVPSIAGHGGDECWRESASVSCSIHMASQKAETIMVDRRRHIDSVQRSALCKAMSTPGTSSETTVLNAKNDILQALSKIIDPDFGTDIVSCGFVKDLEMDKISGEVSFRLELTTPACPIKDMFEQQANEVVAAVPWVKKVSVTMSAQPAKPVFMEEMPKGLRSVSNIIAVSSCKGGVGKSTVAVNLAYTLTGMGARVGIFDSDVYGPSLPTMVSPENRLLQMVPETKSIIPTEYLGVKLVSFGFAGQGRAIMRGPMVSGVINQLLTTTEWGELDYLVIDMPPGTGDIQLTLCQVVPLTAAVIVTTPQKLAFIDVAKGVRMFSKLKVPCVAVVENMCHFDADGKRYYPFGKGSGSQVVQQFGIPYLFELPIRPALSASGDSGNPEVVNEPQGEVAKIFSEIGVCVVQQCAKLRQQVSTAVTYDKTVRAIRVKVPGSDEEFLLHPATVRRNDRSAQSVDEWTGEQKLQYGDVPEDIEPESIKPMGNYAVSITWPDGFSQIAPYDQLQQIERLLDIPKRIPQKDIKNNVENGASQKQMQGKHSPVSGKTAAEAILEHVQALKEMQ